MLNDRNRIQKNRAKSVTPGICMAQKIKFQDDTKRRRREEKKCHFRKMASQNSSRHFLFSEVTSPLKTQSLLSRLKTLTINNYNIHIFLEKCFNSFPSESKFCLNDRMDCTLTSFPILYISTSWEPDVKLFPAS